MTTKEKTSAISPQPRRRGLRIGLWVVQSLLTALFFLAGMGHLASPIDQLRAQNAWVGGAMGQLVRLIGAVEVLGALGLILPAATRIKPWLTPLAAVGLATVMVLAAITHAVRGELSGIAITAVLGAMAAFVAWGRYRTLPVARRS